MDSKITWTLSRHKRLNKTYWRVIWAEWDADFFEGTEHSSTFTTRAYARAFIRKLRAINNAYERLWN